MAGTSDIIDHFVTRIGNLAGLTVCPERKRLVDLPRSVFAGKFEIEIGTDEDLAFWGKGSDRRRVVEIIVNVGYHKSKAPRTAYKASGANREAISKDISNPANYDSGTTGIISATIQEPRLTSEGEQWIDVIPFRVEYKVSWL